MKTLNKTTWKYIKLITGTSYEQTNKHIGNKIKRTRHKYEC